MAFAFDSCFPLRHCALLTRMHVADALNTRTVRAAPLKAVGFALTRALRVQFTAALQARGVTVVPFQLNYTSPAQVRALSRQHHTISLQCSWRCACVTKAGLPLMALHLTLWIVAPVLIHNWFSSGTLLVRPRSVALTGRRDERINARCSTQRRPR